MLLVTAGAAVSKRTLVNLCPSLFLNGIEIECVKGQRLFTYGYSSRPGRKQELGGGHMNAFQLLKEDHQKVSGIFQQLEPTTERAEKTRSELFAKLKEELDIHAKIEETIFYPAIKQA